MKVAVKVSFRLESQNHDSLHDAVADVSRRVKTFGDSWGKAGTIDAIEVRGVEIKNTDEATDRER